MENEYFSFNPGTHTCRAPEVTTFKHLLGFAAKLEQYLTIHNQEDIVNINKLLETTLNLQISNIISRVVAQVIGEYGPGFVTIKGTEDGALHVYLAGSDPASPIDVEISAGVNLIGKVQIEGSSHTTLKAIISFNTAATHDIIAAVALKQHKITTIVFTVAGETNITLRDQTGALTGAMDFGGVSEPRGMVSNHGLEALECRTGEKFQIVNSAAVQVSGYVLYYDE